MTKEQLDKLRAISKRVREICPDMYGSIKFNLNPTRDYSNINIDQSISVNYRQVKGT